MRTAALLIALRETVRADSSCTALTTRGAADALAGPALLQSVRSLDRAVDLTEQTVWPLSSLPGHRRERYWSWAFGALCSSAIVVVCLALARGNNYAGERLLFRWARQDPQPDGAAASWRSRVPEHGLAQGLRHLTIDSDGGLHEVGELLRADGKCSWSRLCSFAALCLAIVGNVSYIVWSNVTIIEVTFALERGESHLLSSSMEQLISIADGHLIQGKDNVLWMYRLLASAEVLLTVVVMALAAFQFGIFTLGKGRGLICPEGHGAARKRLRIAHHCGQCQASLPRGRSVATCKWCEWCCCSACEPAFEKYDPCQFDAYYALSQGFENLRRLSSISGLSCFRLAHPSIAMQDLDASIAKPRFEAVLAQWGWKDAAYGVEVVFFIVTRIMFAALGLLAFGMKLLSTSILLHNGNEDSHDHNRMLPWLPLPIYLWLIIFMLLYSTISSVTLPEIMKHRVLMVLGGKNTVLNEEQVIMQRVYLARIAESIYEEYCVGDPFKERRPSRWRWFILMLTFNDKDLQRLLLSELDEVEGDTLVRSGSSKRSSLRDGGASKRSSLPASFKVSPRRMQLALSASVSLLPGDMNPESDSSRTSPHRTMRAGDPSGASDAARQESKLVPADGRPMQDYPMAPDWD